jgi:hypothetical protein
MSSPMALHVGASAAATLCTSWSLCIVVLSAVAMGAL